MKTENCYLGFSFIVPKTGDAQGDGKLLPHGEVFAGGGDDINDIRVEHLPDVLAEDPAPGLCVVLGGTNDLPALVNPAAIAERIANLRNIYGQLTDGVILPVACAVPTSDTQRANAISLNTEIATLATELALPFVDFFSVTDDGAAGWIVGYSDDGGHPNSVGAKVMGIELRDTLDDWLQENFPPLVTAADDADADLLWFNGRMIDDGNVDGVPDGGNPQVQDAWIVVNGAADTAFSLVPSVELDGNWWRINKTAFTEQTRLWTNAADPIVTSGDTIALGFKCKVASADAATTIIIQAYDRNDAIVSMYKVALADLQAAVDPFVFYKEVVIPSGTTELRLFISINFGLADLYIGQYTVRNLSA